MEATQAEWGKIYLDHDSNGVIIFHPIIKSSLAEFWQVDNRNFNLYLHFVNNCEIIF